MSDPKRFKFDGDGYYIKSAAEMRELWAERNGLPEACDNTLLIAERCDVEFTEGNGNYMPRFPVPEGETEDSWFVKEVEKGLRYRYPDGIPDDVRKQADFEIGVITQMGFPGYFLVVADFINWAKDNGIRVGPGRGSGAGSMCAYAMRITDLDPLEHGLIFERFLNPDRVSMPDFDIDFDERRRGEVIRYVTEKYGDDRVSMIVTYGTIKAKQAVKDSSRILGYPFAMGDRITKAMPAAVMGKDIPLKEIFDTEHKRYGEGGEFRALYDADHDVKTVVDTAIGIEGLKRQWGVHAAGVIMSSEPLLDVIPVMRREPDGAIITQFDYPTCEKLGLIKMDFLGLRNLTVLDDALINIEPQPRREGRARGPRARPTRRRTRCSSAATPSASSSSTAARCGRCCAACSPTPSRTSPRSARSTGPARWAPTPTTSTPAARPAASRSTPIHPELAEPLEEMLGETYGLIVYQEQVMAIAQKLAGYTLGQADLLRRAMGKKKKEELDKQFETFSAGMTERGFSIGRDQDAVGHPAAVLRLRLQQGPLRGLRPGVLLDGLPQGQLPGRVHGRAPDVGQGRQGQDGDLPQRVPPDEDPGAAARRQRVRGQLHPGRRRHPLRPDRDPQRRLERRRRRSSRPAARRAGSPTSPTSWARSPPQVCNKRLIESLIKAGAFDSLEPRPAGAGGDPRAGRRPVRRHQAQRGDRPGLPLRWARRRGRRLRGQRRRCPTSPEWDKTDAARPRARDARPLRLRPPADGARARARRRRRLHDRPAAHRRGSRRDREPVTICRPDHLGAAQDHQDAATPGRSSRSRTSRARSTCCCSPATTSWPARCCSRTRSWRSRATSTASKDQPEVRGREVSHAVPGVGRRAVRSRSRCPSTRCTPPVVEQLKEVLRTHPGTTEVRLKLMARAGTTVLRLDDRLRVTAVARAVRRPQAPARPGLPGMTRLG